MNDTPSASALSAPLRLPCGATLPNRIAKAAMTEGLADEGLRPTQRHVHLYRQWSQGGAGLLLTGNVQVDSRVLERPGNVALDPAKPDAEMRRRLEDWAKAGTAGGNHLWMQISHAGRQSPWYVTSQPLAPSAVKLKLLANYCKPRALTEDEILELIQRFAAVAVTARDTGFTGVQVHGAHGYLLSSFLSPVTNKREDRWGGALENRARMLLETVKTVRAAVGPDFPVAVKLNSADFQKGGFSHDECLQVVGWLNPLGLDLLELSGGTYEQPRVLGGSGKASEAVGEAPAEPQAKAASTRRREAYFLKYAADIRKIATMPLMVTGGFRTGAGMAAALASGAIDVIGLGRPLCTEPDVPARLLTGQVDELPHHEYRLRIGPGIFGPGSKITTFKLVNSFGLLGWHCMQLVRLADGRKPDLHMGLLAGFLRFLAYDYRMAWHRWRAKKAR